MSSRFLSHESTITHRNRERIISLFQDKYPNMFTREMEAIVWVIVHTYMYMYEQLRQSDWQQLNQYTSRILLKQDSKKCTCISTFRVTPENIVSSYFLPREILLCKFCENEQEYNVYTCRVSISGIVRTFLETPLTRSLIMYFPDGLMTGFPVRFCGQIILHGTTNASHSVGLSHNHL